MDLMGEELVEPVSPTGQFFSSSIITVLEMEVPIDDSFAVVQLAQDILLPMSPRFSSIMVTDADGGMRWKRVEVKLPNHIHTPTFPSGMTTESYEQCFDEYLTETAAQDLPQSQPLWEIHIIKYPTRNAAGNVIFKFSHAIGDGYSLMGALLSSLKRADNPALPLTFPSVKLRSDTTQENVFQRFFSGVCSTVSDFCWSNLGLSVNDVITGIVFLGVRLYMLEMDKKSGDAESTALVLLNTRMLGTYKSVEEMAKSDNSDTAWGNRLAFLHVPIPSLTDRIPMLIKTHEIIKRKRQSSAVYLTACLLDLVNKFGGPKITENTFFTI